MKSLLTRGYGSAEAFWVCANLLVVVVQKDWHVDFYQYLTYRLLAHSVLCLFRFAFLSKMYPLEKKETLAVVDAS